MRIRELILHNVRSFRGEHRISFVDPLTDQARPLTVIAGTNGTGKTTIFDAIEEMLQFLFRMKFRPFPLLSSVRKTGLVVLTLELNFGDPGFPKNTSQVVFQFAVGSQDLLPQTQGANWKTLQLFEPSAGQVYYSQYGFPDGFYFREELVQAVLGMQEAENLLKGGLIYFPQDRQLLPKELKPGGIHLPPPNRDWISRLNPPKKWEDSLESFWVGQNYLDLEERAEGNGHSHLKSFVETVETALGEGRKITVKNARAQIPVAWTSKGSEVPKVRLDQLPSGEQQVLLLLGELARRRRPGAVILIDEPETSLHPTLQRLLMHQLRQFARDWDAQLIVATHSMEILRAAHESQRLFLDQIEPTEAAETDAEKAE